MSKEFVIVSAEWNKRLLQRLVDAESLRDKPKKAFFPLRATNVREDGRIRVDGATSLLQDVYVAKEEEVETLDCRTNVHPGHEAFNRLA